MAQSPLVSVLVPVYNGAKHLAESLEAIRAQSYRKLEVLIKDDGSSDDSLAIAADFASRDSRFRLIAGVPSGSATANHVALATLAKGRYLKFVHQDDLIDAPCIATLLKPMLTNPRIVLATSSRRRIDSAGAEQTTPVGAYEPLVRTDAILDGREVIRYSLANQINQIGEPSVTLYRNHVVAPERMFHYGAAEHVMLFDLALWFNLLMRGSLYFHAAPLSSYRVHAGQLSAQETTVLDASFEWLAMIRQAHDTGVLKPGPSLSEASRRRMQMLQYFRGQIAASADLRLQDAYLTRYDAAMAELSQLSSTPVG